MLLRRFLLPYSIPVKPSYLDSFRHTMPRKSFSHPLCRLLPFRGLEIAYRAGHDVKVKLLGADVIQVHRHGDVAGLAKAWCSFFTVWMAPWVLDAGAGMTFGAARYKAAGKRVKELRGRKLIACAAADLCHQ